MIYSQKYQFEFGYCTNFDLETEDLLLDKYQILDYDVEDITAQTQLSKAEVRQNYVYVTIQLPEYDKASQKFVIKDLHCFVSPKWLLIIDRNDSKHFRQFITFQERILSDEEVLDPFIIFYELLDYCVTKAYKAIFRFKSDIANLESDLFRFENDLDVVKDILIIKKDLINFESSIEPLGDMILDLENKSAKFHPESKDRLDSTLDIVKKILNNLKNFKEQMNLLGETNDALMTRSTNHFLRLFTVASLLVAIPNIWTSFFGMNVFFGFPDNYLPLICVILAILITLICIIKYLKIKKWL